MYRIKEILDQKGLTQQMLAEKMGVSPQYISGIIREQDGASVTMLSNIAKVLEVPVASLFEDYISNDNTIICPYCGNKLHITKQD